MYIKFEYPLNASVQVIGVDSLAFVFNVLLPVGGLLISFDTCVTA